MSWQIGHCKNVPIDTRIVVFCHSNMAPTPAPPLYMRFLSPSHFHQVYCFSGVCLWPQFGRSLQPVSFSVSSLILESWQTEGTLFFKKSSHTLPCLKYLPCLISTFRVWKKTVMILNSSQTQKGLNSPML